MPSTADIPFAEHGLVGLGKYDRTLMQRQPPFAQLGQQFANLGRMGPVVRGGSFMDPSQAQQYATGPYLGARGQLAQTNIANMFENARLAALIGATRGNVAAMIPELQAQQVQLGSTGLFGGML